jgi:cold shock CspA family protein
MFVGTVCKVIVDKGYGFIRLPGSVDVFMHSYDVSDELDWGEQLQERRVEFDLEHSAKGPRAVLVRPAK